MKLSVLSVLFGLASLFLVLSCMGLMFPIDLFLALVAGWAIYLYRVVPQAHINMNEAATAIVCLAGFTFGLHRFLRWLSRGARKPLSERDETMAGPEPERGWRPRWTAAAVAVIVLMFAAGLAAAGLVHQVGWLITSDAPFLDGLGGAGPAVIRAQSMNNLKQIGLALQFDEREGRLLPGCTADREGELLQSWMTLVLPFIDEGKLFAKIDLELPWDHPRNAPPFQQTVNTFVHPGYADRPMRDHRGYAQTSYAANVRVLGGTRRLSRAELTDGTAETILAGEIAERFPAWGKPGNWRDPARGVNKEPEGFGGPSPGGANFLFMDGSVRFLKDSTDPKVLKALSTPAGGEKVSAAEY